MTKPSQQGSRRALNRPPTRFGFADPRESVVPVVMSVVVGALLSMAFHQAAVEWRDRIREDRFRQAAQFQVEAIDAKLQRVAVAAQSLGHFYAASHDVSAREFASFARFLLESDPEIYAVEWQPRVADGDRAVFEEQARRDGLTGFRIRDLVDGRLQPAARRPEYFPIYRLEPARANAVALGFDPSGDPVRAADFSVARDSGRAVASRPLVLVQEPGQQRGLAVLVPQYLDGSAGRSVPERRDRLRGYAVVVVRLGQLVDGVLARLPRRDLDVALSDSADRGPSDLLHLHAAPREEGAAPPGPAAFETNDLLYQAPVTVAGRPLSITVAPVPGAYPVDSWPLAALAALAAGFALTVILVLLAQSRRNAMARLTEREARLRLFIEHAPAALAIFDREMRYLAVSRRWLKDYGLGEQDLLGRSHYEIFPEIPERWREVHRRAQGGETVQAEEDPFERQDGRIQWLRWEVRPWRDSLGRVAGIGVFTEEITERKQAELELSRFRQIVETSSENLLFIEPDTRLRVVNPAYARMFGATPEELQGRVLADLLGGDTYERMMEHLRAALAGEPQRFHLDSRYPDGKRRSMEVEQRPFLVDGKVQGVVASLHDATDARRARAALELQQAHLADLVAARTAELQAAEAQVRSILDSSADGIFGLDAKGRVIFVNPSACRLLGFRADALMGREIHSLVHHSLANGEPYPAHRCPVLAALRENRNVRIDDEVFWDANGRPIPVTYSARPMMRDGEAIGVVVNFLDMTVPKAVEAAREAALKEAERLAQVRSEFLANMSHEIRTPLNGVLGLARVGQQQSGGRKIQETFDLILSSGQHLLGVVDDILDFSKIEAGKLLLEQHQIELGRIIDRAMTLVSGRAYSKGLELRVEESADLPQYCRGDALRLSQILVNLLANAIKFTERGQVVLGALTDGDCLVFQVSDSGIGMSADQVSSLFAPFQQADGSTSRRFGGTGLGLAISRHLVGLMGGTILVDSRLGEGSVFEVRLPLVEPSAGPRRAAGVIGFLGLPEGDAEWLAGSLQAHGVTVAAQSDQPAAELLLAACPPVTCERLAELVSAGRRVAVYHPNGAGELPDHLRDAVRVLDVPLRVRHLLAALTQEGGAPRAVSVPPGPRLAGMSILAAEDNEVNRLVLGQLLASEGASLICFEDGRALLQHLSEVGDGGYQILLTDIQMPGLDGYETARQCRERYPGLPVIGLTAHAMPEERQRCLSAGMAEHVSKPVDIDRLVGVIRQFARPPAGPADIRPRPGGSDAPRPLPDSPAASSPAEPELPSAADDPIIDLAGLTARYRDKPAFLGRLFSILRDTYSDGSLRLREAAREGNMTALSVEAHDIKGMSGNLMAWRLYRLAQTLESAARAGEPQARELAERLAEQLDELLSVLPRNGQPNGGQAE